VAIPVLAGESVFLDGLLHNEQNDVFLPDARRGRRVHR
jgi:hypothetical protein